MADACILLLGDHEALLTEWAERLRALDFRPVRAKTAPDALAFAEERGHRFRIALIDADLPVLDLDSALTALRRHRSADRLSCLGIGTRPDRDGLEQLRASGIERALWEPTGDHLLRFELNRAFANHRESQLRSERRVATEWRTPIIVAGRKKQGSLYSLSATGCYVDTARPSMRGAKAIVELSLPSGALRVAGTVVYANVPGNLRKKNLPTGMALRFDDVPPEQQRRIREAIDGLGDVASV